MSARLGDWGSRDLAAPTRNLKTHKWQRASTWARYPIAASGLRSQWKRDRKRAAKTAPSTLTFRFHDNRHTAGTRLLRHTRNLKMVQNLLNHARIATTAK